MMQDGNNQLAHVENDPLKVIARLELPLTISLGSARLSLIELLSLGSDSSIELDRRLSDPVDIRINGTLVAQGDLVKVDGTMGVRITRMVHDCR